MKNEPIKRFMSFTNKNRLFNYYRVFCMVIIIIVVVLSIINYILCIHSIQRVPPINLK